MDTNQPGPSLQQADYCQVIKNACDSYGHDYQDFNTPGRYESVMAYCRRCGHVITLYERSRAEKLVEDMKLPPELSERVKNRIESSVHRPEVQEPR